MPRIRTIKPEFWTNRRVMECARDARLLFIGLWNFCDDYGKHPNAPKQIKAEILPGDDISSEEVRRLLDELADHGLIEIYTFENTAYLRVIGWEHQKIDRRQRAKYPGPNGEMENPSTEPFDERSSSIRSGVESSRVDLQESSRSTDSRVASRDARESVLTQPEIDKIAGQIMRLAEASSNHGGWALASERVSVWIANGWSPDADILPAVKKVLLKRRNSGQTGPPRTIHYFEKEIAKLHAARTAPLPQIKSNGRRHHAEQNPRSAIAAARRRKAAISDKGSDAGQDYADAVGVHKG